MPSLISLPLHLVRELAVLLVQDSSSLRSLSLSCKALHETCRPLLYNTIKIEKSTALLSVACDIFTHPELAREVRSLQLPALAAVPTTERRKWPSKPGLGGVLARQVAAATDEASYQECLDAVRDGSREDLVAMLILMNTPGLEELTIGAMGPPENQLTRTIFCRAAPLLAKLHHVAFGATPEMDIGESEDSTYSFSLFADLFRLPAVKSIFAHAIAPRSADKVVSDGIANYKAFSFIRDLREPCASLEALHLSEQFAVSNGHLSHLLSLCPALQELSFHRVEVPTWWNTGWGTVWTLPDFQAALERRSDTLKTLSLTDCLFHDTATWHDERSNIRLRGLTRLTRLVLHADWSYDGHDTGMEAPRGADDPLAQRLVRLLPEALEELYYLNPGDDGGPCDHATSAMLSGLVDARCAGRAVPHLRLLQVDELSRGGHKLFLDAFDRAEKAGIAVYTTFANR